MVSWVLVAVVIIFPLIQVPLVIYLGRYTRLREGETPGRPGARDYWTESEGGTGADDYHGREEPPDDRTIPDRTVCPECGTANDPSYQYCGDCATSL